jgi:aspartyl-tRNA synthetase
LPERIPKIKMEEAYEIVGKGNVKEDGDLTPEGKKKIWKYTKETYGNDFVFIIDYPYSARPFYHMKGQPKKLLEALI